MMFGGAIWKNYHRKISKDEIVKKVREVREKEGRLVAINGYVNKEKSNIIVYTLEYDEFRKHYHIEGENILPTITNIYIEHNGLRRKYKRLCQ